MGIDRNIEEESTKNWYKSGKVYFDRVKECFME
jgi:hypothetical protein